MTLLALTLTSISGMFCAKMSLTKLAGVVPDNVIVYEVITPVPILVTPIVIVCAAVNGFAAIAVPLDTVFPATLRTNGLNPPLPSRNESYATHVVPAVIPLPPPLESKPTNASFALLKN